jgi:hypothetical protein
MNKQEAKFILGVYRPNGLDAGDATFNDALALAEKDPELRAWFSAQSRFDNAVTGKLKEVVPPPGLREAILAGGRVSAVRAKSAWRTTTIWLAAAAAIALVASVAVKFRSGSGRPNGVELAAFALDDLANHDKQHIGSPPGSDAVVAQLTNARVPLMRGLDVNLDALRKEHCRIVRVDGKEVFELCFKREGSWYHVYIGHRRDFAPGSIDPRAAMTVQGQFAATAWADAEHVYAVVTRDGPEALQRLI